MKKTGQLALLVLLLGLLTAQINNPPNGQPGNFTTGSFSGQLTSTLATGTAPFVIASTTPVSNLVVASNARMQACGTTSSCAATALTSAQTVWGSAPLVTGTPSTVTISGISPAFTSSSSYKCFIQDQTAPANNTALSLTYSSGSSFIITGPNTNTDVIVFTCNGN